MTGANLSCSSASFIYFSGTSTLKFLFTHSVLSWGRSYFRSFNWLDIWKNLLDFLSWQRLRNPQRPIILSCAFYLFTVLIGAFTVLILIPSFSDLFFFFFFFFFDSSCRMTLNCRTMVICSLLCPLGRKFAFNPWGFSLFFLSFIWTTRRKFLSWLSCSYVCGYSWE